MSDLQRNPSLELERDNDWLTVWLNRPQSRNALTAEMVEELALALDAVRKDRDIRGVSFRGRGGVFCAGGDIKGFETLSRGTGASPAEVALANHRAGDLFDLIDRLPQVVVMLVEGAAIAGGLGMLCAADLVVATESARFALSETTLGITPAQIAPFVVRRIGLPAARRIMLTAARFDGRAALGLGLVDEVVDGAAALATAELNIRSRVRNCAPGANGVTKEILLATDRLDREAMKQFAAERFAACMLSDEGREGIAAFIEKRQPRWAG